MVWESAFDRAFSSQLAGNLGLVAVVRRGCSSMISMISMIIAIGIPLLIFSWFKRIVVVKRLYGDG